ncbi:hypothetical protein EZS27_017937 [termite gut metagenome]|uniref:FecR protein domain-containing protein n=1 Tax=termite gut metagenome TaxID=433724 RepID=A0A5J4RKK0_9ZZZZ
MSKIRQIIQEYFNNTYSESIRKKFSIWLVDSKATEEKDKTLQEIWDNLNISADTSTESSYLQLQHRLFIGRKTYRRQLFRKIEKITAVFLIPILSVAFSYFYLKNSKLPAIENIEYAEYFVPNGEIRTLTLPDSSKVLLNSGSVLIYPQKFDGKTRDLYLNGEACFTVVRDENKPFIVKTQDMHVEVLGTVFNVSSYADSGNSSTTLESGVVNIRLKNKQSESILLKPNEQMLYNRKSGVSEVKQVNIETILAWKEGHLVLQSMSMDEIIKTIERRYDVTIFLNSNKYNKEKITAKFIHGEKINEFFAVLQQLIPYMKYKIEGKKVYIY